MSLLRNVAGMLLTSAVTIPIGLATSILLARFLSVEDRGLYAVVTAFAMLGAALARFGWPAASIHLLRRRGVQPARVAGASLATAVVLSALILGLCAAFQPVITKRLLNDASPTLLALAALLIPLHLLTFFYSAIARGIDRFPIQNWNGFLHSAGSLLVVTGVLVFGSGTLAGVLAALVALRLALTAGLIGAVVRHTGINWRLRGAELRDGLRFGLKSRFQALAGMLHERIDVFMLAFLLADPAQVAYYAIAVGVIERVKLAPGAFAAATFPEVAGLPEREAARLVCTVSRQSTVLLAGTVLLLGAVAPLLIPLVYGEPYAASIAPFAILLPGTALLGIYSVLGRYFAGIDRQQVNIATQGVSVAVNIGLNLWWIPIWGITGAAAASLVSYSLEAALITAVFVRSSGRGLGELFVIGRDDVEAYRRRVASWLS
ncbi:MAG: oligosaccharide flippase family protein [Proteobacteria bacterium]|nr:oligosaccharide flippase family protein [Pseudomonadota bacterium]